MKNWQAARVRKSAASWLVRPTDCRFNRSKLAAMSDLDIAGLLKLPVEERLRLVELIYWQSRIRAR